jgi:hypothetical protein
VAHREVAEVALEEAALEEEVAVASREIQPPAAAIRETLMEKAKGALAQHGQTELDTSFSERASFQRPSVRKMYEQTYETFSSQFIAAIAPTLKGNFTDQ